MSFLRNVLGMASAITAIIVSSSTVCAQAVNISNGSTINIPGPSYPSSYETYGSDVAGYGFRSVNGSTINATDVAVITNGDRAVGLYVSSGAAPALITMTNGSIVTKATGGDGSASAYGVFVNGAGGRIELTDTLISTAGVRAYGFYSVNGTHSIASNVTVTTTGQSAYGIHSRGNGNVTIGQNSYIETTGTGASGVLAAARGTVDISDSTIVTRGQSAGALGASADASGWAAGITARNLIIETYGARASGVTAFQRDSSVDISDSSIHTRAANSYGLLAESVAKIDAQRLAIVTEGEVAYGAYARNDNSSSLLSVINIENSSIRTSGTSGDGLYAEGTGVVNATDVGIETSGSRAHGMAAIMGGTVNFENGTVVTTATDAAGMASLTTTGQINKFRVTDASIRSGGDGFLAIGSSDVVFAASKLDADNGIALHFQSGKSTFLADGSELNGAGITGAGAVSELMLQNSSVWNVTGASNLTQLANEASTIIFSAPSGDITHSSGYKTLTVGGYTGAEGLLVLNTYLGNDHSPSDRLVIDQGITGGSGAATGMTSLLIRNTGGLGASTTGDGILVVQVLNGAQTTLDSPSDPAQSQTFRLSGRVAAGAYEYLLFSGGNGAAGGDPNDQNWYLRSTYTPDPNSGGPGDAEIPIIRPEVPTSAVIVPLAVEYGYAMLDTLHERIGETYGSPAGTSGQNDVRWARSGWARLIGHRGFHDAAGYWKQGPDYDYSFGAIEAGLDLYARELPDGTLDKAGLYAGYGQISATVKGQPGAFYGGKAGSIAMDAYTLGGYWTHFSPHGWYTDAVVQGTWYSADARSVLGQRIKPEGFGLLASLEGGYAFRLGDGWVVEPQAQLVYHKVSFENARDSFGQFRFGDGESIRGRLGIRLAKTWNMAEGGKPSRLMTAWLRGNIWHEFKGRTQTTAGSFDGSNPVVTQSSLGGTWGEIGAGISGQVSERTTLFASAAYKRSLDNRGRQAWDGRLGVTVRW